MPCLRQTSTTLSPDSASRNTRRISSSLCFSVLGHLLLCDQTEEPLAVNLLLERDTKRLAPPFLNSLMHSLYE